MAAHLFSRLDPFDCQKGDFDYYSEQFDHFLVLNSVEEESKKVPLFISSIGQEAYKILKEICAPADPKERSFDQLKALLQEYFARREFYRRNQRPGEYTGAFINELKRLSVKCNFGPFAHDALRDRIACGKLPEDKPDKKPPPPLSSSSSVPTAGPASTKGQSVPPVVAQVAAAKSKKQLQATLDSLVANLVEPKKQPKGPKPQPSGSAQRKCKICGHDTHKENECPHKDASCYMCRKKGHIASVCREKANKGQQQQQPVQVHVHVQQNTGVKN